MFKDYDKYLRASLNIYMFLLVVICILKLVGLDYFGLKLNNQVLITISDYLSTTHWGDLYYFSTLLIQTYFMLSLSTDKKSIFIQAFLSTGFIYFFQCIINIYYKMDWIYPILCFVVIFIVPMIILKKITFKNQLKYIILMNLYQLISLFIRSIGINTSYNNFLVESLLNIDQLLLLAITYNLHFMKGGSKLCGEEVEVFSSLQMKKNFSNLQRKLQKSYSNFKELNKEEKATVIIYTILSLIWNVFTLVVVLLIGSLNDTLIECIFIITSFWLSKRIFGKAFHLKSMLQCFGLSNLTYYVLNRITTPLGISILIPIMLGVGLSYVTSKFVKKKYMSLYKGMPLEEFNDSILKVLDKDSTNYKICYDYFIEKENAIFLGRKYNYTEANIRKITGKANDDIKALN